MYASSSATHEPHACRHAAATSALPQYLVLLASTLFFVIQAQVTFLSSFTKAKSNNPLLIHATGDADGDADGADVGFGVGPTGAADGLDEGLMEVVGLLLG